MLTTPTTTPDLHAALETGETTARNVADVRAAVAVARALGLAVVPRATGHGTAAAGSLDGTLLLRTGELGGVRVDPDARVARVGAGTTWGELAACAGEHGLAGLAGTHESVGVVGYTLGGGLGRRHGLAAGDVRAIELVDAAGRLVRADAEHEPELFWALRGGGGQPASSRRSSSSCIPCARSAPGRWCGRPSAHARSCGAGARGSTTCLPS